MDMATFLKGAANLIVGAAVAKWVAGDLVRRSPYPVAGAAALLGLIAGWRLGAARNSATLSTRWMWPVKVPH